MNLENHLDRIHRGAIENTWLQLFTVFTRTILGVGFIPPSIKKILGQPFTMLPDSNPVGHYFNALYQTGFYYEFIGWGQFAAALLLLFPRTAHLGAVMFFPIILNITVLTNSVGFGGTKYITMLMLVASSYLICWEYDRLKPLIFSKRASKTRSTKLELLWLPCLSALVGAAAVCFFGYARVANIHQRFVPALMLASAVGFAFGLICALHHKFMKVGSLERSAETI